MKHLVTFLLSLAAECVVLPWHGYVLTILWGWFVVPLFGAPVLSIPVAIGLCLIYLMFRGSELEDMKDEPLTQADVLDHILMRVLLPAALLAIGFAVVSF